MMNSDTNIIYRLNGKDEFSYVNDEWVAFALANDARDLLPENVLGRSLWGFITDETTRVLYREILQTVRTGRPARFSLRCDSPERRRYLEIAIVGQDGGAVQIETTTTQVEERPRQALLDRQAPRAADALRMCGWCKCVDVGGGIWGELEEAVTLLGLFERPDLPIITHGMCEACYKVMTEKLAELRARDPMRS